MFEQFSGCAGAVSQHSEGQQCPAVRAGLPRARQTQDQGNGKQRVCYDTTGFLAVSVTVLSFPWDYVLFPVSSDVAGSYGMY